MKLVKSGKVFDLDKATLIATSSKFTSYGTRQYRLYKSVNGTFFKTETCNYICRSSNKIVPQYHHPEEKIINLPSLEEVRDIYEYTTNGGTYSGGNYEGGDFQYELHVKYEDLFDLVEG